MKVLFCGTPGFAVPSLDKLLRSGHQVVGVVTQPDRPRGRCREPQSPPVKEIAEFHSLPVFQPDRPADPKFLSAIQNLGADIAAVVAYGRLLPKEFLASFPHGAINLHASLLPKYRGAAPIQWSIIRGETETGATIFQLDTQLDHGPLLLQTKTPIEENEDATRLAARLSELGAQTLLEALDLLESGMTATAPQDHSLATQAPILTKQDGVIDWTLPAETIRNRIRGLQPWPGALTWLDGQLLKILSATAQEVESSGKAPGTILTADPTSGLIIQTGKGTLKIDRLQPSGGNPMTAPEFLRGHPIPPGKTLHTS